MKSNVVITKGLVCTNATFSLISGVALKKVVQYLGENGYQIVAWTNSSGRTYASLEEKRPLEGTEFIPEKISREDLEFCLRGTIVEIE